MLDNTVLRLTDKKTITLLKNKILDTYEAYSIGNSYFIGGDELFIAAVYFGKDLLVNTALNERARELNREMTRIYKELIKNMDFVRNNNDICVDEDLMLGGDIEAYRIVNLDTDMNFVQRLWLEIDTTNSALKPNEIYVVIFSANNYMVIVDFETGLHYLKNVHIDNLFINGDEVKQKLVDNTELYLIRHAMGYIESCARGYEYDCENETSKARNEEEEFDEDELYIMSEVDATEYDHFGAGHNSNKDPYNYFLDENPLYPKLCKRLFELTGDTYLFDVWISHKTRYELKDNLTFVEKTASKIADDDDELPF